MNKKIFCLVIAMLVCTFFLISCSRDKDPADLAIKAAETSINTARAEAVKFVPDQLKSLENSLASAKDKFAKGEYKAALDEATPLDVKAKSVLVAAKAKKEELTKKWAETSQDIPKMIEDVQGKVDALSKLKRLPAKLKKDKFEEAKAGLASAKDEWTKAQESFKNANFTDAINVAGSVKDKVIQIMESLGMSVPAPVVAPVVAPAAAPAPVPTIAPATAPAKAK
ncbi:MAG: hypothetical protein ABSC11_03020 [Smithella sp.]|jgi:peptidoglycan hydrolase CwlO-like protein